MKLKNKTLAFLCAGTATLAIAAAAYYFSISSAPSEANITTAKHNATTSKRLRIEAVQDGQYTFVKEQNVPPSLNVINIPETQDFKEAKRYNLLLTLEDENNLQPTEISLLIDKKLGYMRASIEGAEKDGIFLVNGKHIEQKKSNYYEVINLSSQPQTMCFDLGGLRGGSMSICHSTQTDIKNASLSSALSSLGLPSFRSFANDVQTNWGGAFRAMAAQKATTAFQQTEAKGRFLDAKSEKEQARDVASAKADAQNKFSPSERGCKIISQSRGLKPTKKHAEQVTASLTSRAQNRALGTGSSPTFLGEESDARSRIKQIEDHFNDPTNSDLYNQDVDFYTLVSSNKTIPMDLEDMSIEDKERAIFAFTDNALMPEAAAYIPPSILNKPEMAKQFQKYREVQSRRSILQSILSQDIGERASGPSNNPANDSIREDLKEKGYTDAQIDDPNIMGAEPSLYAQEDHLEAERMTDPNFHTEGSGEGPDQVARTNVQSAQSKLKAAKRANDEQMNQTLLNVLQGEAVRKQMVEELNAWAIGMYDL